VLGKIRVETVSIADFTTLLITGLLMRFVMTVLGIYL
jgi:hypothetical protein